MICFTADTHFDHANIIRFCNRHFATVEEMNETLIANWNRKVHGNDTVYILGDMFFQTTDPEPILRQLKGKKHLITGNHDSQWTHPRKYRHGLLAATGCPGACFERRLRHQ